jgi:hypothetical protein
MRKPSPWDVVYCEASRESNSMFCEIQLSFYRFLEREFCQIG